ncbi:MAG: hypothetical protein HY784_06165 [Chloroflexi bacterium]|nr:hypothetical protein [Chloroflexota bacterium]
MAFAFRVLPPVALALAACRATVAVPAPPTAPLPAIAPYRLASPEYGIQAFLWWHVDTTGERDLRRVSELGFGWVKQVFAWRDLEGGGKGQFDWYRADRIVSLAEAAGLSLLVRLDHQPYWAQDPAVEEWLPDAPPADSQDFGDYCYALASRYRGRIRAYEVWNEPNLARDWGNQPPDPAAYTALLKACYLGIKRGDREALVISAGLAPTGTYDETAMPDMLFYQGMYEAGAAPYFDLLGAHAPGYMNPPERDPAEVEADPALGYRWLTFRHVEDIRRLMIASGDAGKQIAITEMGWTSDPTNPAYAWYAVPEATKADYLVRAYTYARQQWSPWIVLMSSVYIADPDWTPANEQYYWAITRPDGALLPGYEALRGMGK